MVILYYVHFEVPSINTTEFMQEEPSDHSPYLRELVLLKFEINRVWRSSTAKAS